MESIQTEKPREIEEVREVTIGKKYAWNQPRLRSETEIIAAILTAAARNGGESITTLKQKANVSPRSIDRYVNYMIESGLLTVEQSYERATKLYKPTVRGREFVTKQDGLLELLDAHPDGPISFEI